MNTTPLEADDCKALVQWMDFKGLKFSHVPSETFTKSWRQKTKNKQMGVRKGVPDYLIIIPADRSKTEKAEVVFLEVKREKGGRLSTEQKEWIAGLKEASQHVFVGKGLDECIAILEMFVI